MNIKKPFNSFRHGMFTLQHSFEQNYASGTELAAWQWAVMANPAIITAFDSADDAMAKINRAIIIDRYKMPGLNPQGTDIAEDMTYGYEKNILGKVYSIDWVNEYKKSYEQNNKNK